MSSNSNLIYVIKSSGEKVKFSLDKLRHSLKRSGAEDDVIEKIVKVVYDELYQGITTHEIYNRAYSLLKKNKSIHASKYKLKKAISELKKNSGSQFDPEIVTAFINSIDKIEN